MKKNKGAIFIAAGSALVITVVAYLIWGKKTSTTTLPSIDNQPDEPIRDENLGGIYGNDGDYYGGDGVFVSPMPTTRWSNYKVNTSSGGLNVRNAPSSSATVVSSLPKGSIIYAKPSSTSGWHEYSINGLSSAVAGYVSSAYLIPA